MSLLQSIKGLHQVDKRAREEAEEMLRTQQVDKRAREEAEEMLRTQQVELNDEDIANLEKDKIKLQNKIYRLERKNAKLESLHSKLKVKYNRVLNECVAWSITQRNIISPEEVTLGRTWSSEAVCNFSFDSKSVTFDESKNTIVASIAGTRAF